MNRRYAELARIVAAYQEWLALTDDVAAATEMAADDASIAGELPGDAGAAGGVAPRSCAACSSRATPTTAAT